MKKTPLIWIGRRVRKRIPMILLMTAAQVGQALFLVLFCRRGNGDKGGGEPHPKSSLWLFSH